MQIAPLTTTPTPAPAAPQPAPVAIPTAFREQLATIRTALDGAIAAVRQLDRTAPLTSGEAVSSVLTQGRSAVSALRAAVEIADVPEDVQRAAAAAYPYLHDGIHLLEDVVRLGAPARTDLVVDAVDLAFTRAWVTIAGVEAAIAGAGALVPTPPA